MRQSQAGKKLHDKNRVLKSRLGKTRDQRNTVDRGLIRALEVKGSRDNSSQREASLDQGSTKSPDLQQYNQARIDRYEMQLVNNESTMSANAARFEGYAQQLDWESAAMPYND